MENKITYNDKKHEYKVNGKVVPSVTSILSAIGLAPDYSKVARIDEYAEVGTKIHSAIEDYIKTGNIENDYMPSSLIDRIDDLRASNNELKSEVLIYSSEFGYAGRADLIVEYEHCFIVYDFKSGKTVNDEVIKAQLSMYGYAYAEMTGKTFQGSVYIYNMRAEVMDGGISFAEDVGILNSDKIKDYMDCYNQGKNIKEYYGLSFLDDSSLVELENTLTQIADLDRAKKVLEKNIKEVKDNLLKNMIEYDIKSFKGHNFSFTIKRGGFRKSVDTEKMKVDGIYDDYVKEVEISDSLVISGGKE